MSADSIVFRNALVSIGGVDLSAQIKSATLNYNSEMLDRTTMGDTTKNRRGGLFDWSVELEALQSFSAAVDATLFPLVGTSVDIELRISNSCTTAINPRYTGVGCLESYQPMAGNVGTLLTPKPKFMSAGALSRSTTAT